MKFNGLDKIYDPGNRDVTGSTGRGLDDGGGDPGSAVAGDDDPVGAEAMGRADEGAEVLGVLNPVEQKDEARGKGRMTVCDDFLEARVGKLPAKAQHALVGCCACLAVEGFPPANLHRDAPG